MGTKIKLRLRPSLAGQYYEMHRCDRFLFAEAVKEKSVSHENAAARAGIAWEKILIKKIQEEENCELIDLTDKKERNAETDQAALIEESLGKTLDTLRNLSGKAQTGRCIYIYQSCFNVNRKKKDTKSCGEENTGAQGNAFRKKYLEGFRNIEVAFGTMYPDFLKAEYTEDGRYRLTVLDAKNASHLKAGAQIQIALYVKIIQSILEEEGIRNCYMNEEEGIVWNREKVTDEILEHPFPLADAFDELDVLFSAMDGPLAGIDRACGEKKGKDPISKENQDSETERIREKLGYCVTAACGYCDQFEDCRNRCIRARSVRIMPGITVEAQKRLDEVIKEGRLENDRFDTVRDLLCSEHGSELTDLSSYWRHVRNDLDAYEKAMKILYSGKTGGSLGYKYLKGNRFSRKGTSVSMPGYQDFALYLTAQEDVNSGRNYGYAWFLRPGKGINLDRPDEHSQEGKQYYEKIGEWKNTTAGKERFFDSVIAREPSQEAFDRADRTFVESIYKLLEGIDKYTGKKKRLQIYVMDVYEWKNIENALYRMLQYLNVRQPEEEKLCEKVIQILFWLQGERMATDCSQLPEKCVENPVCVISREIAQLYVLPEAVKYTLRNAAEIFDKSEYPQFTKAQKPYFGVLENAVDGMRIIEAWENKEEKSKEEKIEDLGCHLRRRLFKEHDIVSAIQYDSWGKTDSPVCLSAWAPAYGMAKAVFPDDTGLARLAYANQYEKLLAYHRILSGRAAGIRNAIDDGNILELELMEEEENGESGQTFRILNRESYIGREWFEPGLCEDTAQNRVSIMKMREVYYRPFALGDREKSAQEDPEKNEAGDTAAGTAEGAVSCSAKEASKSEGTGTKAEKKWYNEIRLAYHFYDDGNVATITFDGRVLPTEEEKKEAGSPKKKYLLFERYTDRNVEKTAAGIASLASRPELKDPEEMCGDTQVRWDEESERICAKYWSPDGRIFSESQKRAFTHVLERKLTVLWGPPASGKTDFIARTLITMAGYVREKEKRNLRIMVTAMSHAAIENVLLRLESMRKKQSEELFRINPVGLYKAGRFDDGKAFEDTGVILCKEEESEKAESIQTVLCKDETQIIGMTCWGAARAFLEQVNANGEGLFDMIVMDEASQIRAMDAFLTLVCAKKDARFLLVGDDEQLPPIIEGKYEDTGGKYIFGSVFRMFRSALGTEHPDIVRLYDNFRMNVILSRYAAKELYGTEYGKNTFLYPQIKDQTITLRNSEQVQERKNTDRLAFILDEEYPLVFCMLSGSRAGQRDAEVKLVTELVEALWRNQVNPETGNPASEDGNFWRDKVTDDGVSLEGACGIISPHHRQINRLRTSIGASLAGMDREGYDREHQSEIYIGTVDKLQGKERKTVIVSYGVHDMEQVKNEQEFIFSRNRFNVSLTRGKAKTIVILSDVITQPGLETNRLKGEDEETKNGIEYIHGFAAYMRKELSGEQLDYYAEAGELAEMRIWKKRWKGTREEWMED